MSIVLTNIKCNLLMLRYGLIMPNSSYSGWTVSMMKQLLCNVLKCSNIILRQEFLMWSLKPRKCLHQLMFVDQDYERAAGEGLDEKQGLMWMSLIGKQGLLLYDIWCKDRPNLLFHTIFSLSVMQYVVFHVNVYVKGPIATFLVYKKAKLIVVVSTYMFLPFLCQLMKLR